VDLLARQLHVSKIVMNAATLNEGTLVPQDQTVEITSQPVCHALGDELPEAVDKADWAVVLDLRWLIVLFK